MLFVILPHGDPTSATWNFSDMAAGIIVIILSMAVAFLVINRLKARYPFIDAGLLRGLFFFHLLLFFAYYGYVLTSPSDSKWYYQKVVNDYRGIGWFDFYGTSTTFIEFIGYPFIKYLGFSYEAIMALFSLMGYLGFVYFYIFLKENMRFKHKVFGIDLLTLFIFLPNLHFWSASFGKGAIIFLGMGLFFYGISKMRTRLFAIIIGGLIIYHVRPHIMLVILVSSLLGFMFSTRGIKFGWRLFFLAGATVALIFIYRDVLQLVGIDDEAPLQQSLDLTHRATELTKATSGVDITSYSLPLQVFTFIYRPLFFDAPGLLGLIVSFENAFYLAITLLMFPRLKGFKFLFTGNFLVKTAFLSFITVAIALAQISGNLGLAIRQKSQVMMLFLFVVLSFLDEQKLLEWKNQQMEKIRKARIQKLRHAAEAQRLAAKE